LSIIAIGFFIYGLTDSNGQNNEISIFFNIVLALWSTVFIEKWKQRKNELAYFWDMHKIKKENQIKRDEFKGITVIDKNTIAPEKKSFDGFFKRGIWLEFPLL